MFRPKVAHDGDDEYCPRHSKEKERRARAYAPNKMLIQAHAFFFPPIYGKVVIYLFLSIEY